MLSNLLSWSCSAVFLIVLSYVIVDVIEIKHLTLNALIGRCLLVVIMSIITVFEIIVI